MPDFSAYEQISAALKLLAHPERLRILDVLRRRAECVCHLEALMDKPQPYISQQLRILRDAGVISDQKQGQNVFYRLDDPRIEAWLETVLGPTGTPTDPGVQPPLHACVCPQCSEAEGLDIAESTVRFSI